MRKILRLLLGPPVLAVLCFASLAVAGPITYNPQLDPMDKLFGHLNQHDTICGAMGCGPTAALNSLVFLQNKYPTTYGTDLVPAVTTDLNGDGDVNEYDAWISAANDLA
jgi:hypothetical protein